MPRPQFTLRSLLVAMLVVWAFFAGAAWQRETPPKILSGVMCGSGSSYSGVDTLIMPDGTKWFRVVYEGEPDGTLVFPGANGERITVEARPKFPP